MLEWLAGTVSAVAIGGATYAVSRHVGARRRHYYELAMTRPELLRGQAPVVAAAPPAAELRDAFHRDSIVRVADFLTPESFNRIRAEALANAYRKKRSYVPTHKKGGTISYEALHRACPACLAFYHSAAVQDWVSELVREPIGTAGDHDQSANSLLIYDEAGDHIDWHYDHNFYKGRQFTALISLVNQSATGGLPACKFAYRSTGQIEREADTSENSFVVFEGAYVRHRATPTEPGDLRIVLSMTFNTDARISILGEALRRMKDTAFYGMRVLWT